MKIIVTENPFNRNDLTYHVQDNLNMPFGTINKVQKSHESEGLSSYFEFRQADHVIRFASDETLEEVIEEIMGLMKKQGNEG